jgi:CheY-like chemotaxis protein
MTDKREIFVLIIDDDYIARLIHKSIVESFEQFNFVIAESGSGIEGLQLIRDKYQAEHRVPDLIILDAAMPVMSGFDFVEAFIHEDIPNETKIIMVTASDNPEHLEKSKSLGIDYFLTKPLTFDKLKAAIVECV